MHSSDSLLEKNILEEIRLLEESLWVAGSRFDNKLMDEIFAPDFFEFGRSGKKYSRAEMMFEQTTSKEIKATLPLPNFHARYLASDVVQVTYVSEVFRDDETVRSNRSSIWSRINGKWRLRFHQGTPT